MGIFVDPMAVQFGRGRDGSWQYRKDQTAPPVRVTEAERDSYVRWYRRIMVGALPVMMGAIVAGALVLYGLFPDASEVQSTLLAFVGTAFAWAVTWYYLKWFSHAPARAFADRPTVGEDISAQHRANTRAKERRDMARHGYGKIALYTVMGMVVFWVVNQTKDATPEQHQLMTVIGVILPLALGLFIAYRKWRSARP